MNPSVYSANLSIVSRKNQNPRRLDNRTLGPSFGTMKKGRNRGYKKEQPVRSLSMSFYKFLTSG